MDRIVVWILRAPWWVYILLAGLIAYGGESAYQRMAKKHAFRVEAAQSQVPQSVDLSTFTHKDITPAGEVHVEGWINPDLNTHLIRKRNLIQTGEAYVMVMFGREDGPEADVARAAIKMTEAQKNRFMSVAERSVVDFDQGRLILAVNGLRVTSSSFHSHLKDVLREKGVRLGSDFVWITPFVDGREAGLVDDGELTAWRGGYMATAAMFLLVSMVKFYLLRRRKHPKDVIADGPVLSGVAGQSLSGKNLASISPEPTGATNGAEMPKDLVSSQSFSAPRAEAITDDSPLGRMQRRDQEIRAFMTASHVPAETRSFRPRVPDVSVDGLNFGASPAKRKPASLRQVGYIVLALFGLLMVLGGAGFGAIELDIAGGGGLFSQLKAGLGGVFGGDIAVLFGVLLSLVGMFFIWSLVVRPLAQAVGRGGDKDAAAAIKAKMNADPFEKLARENSGPIQSSR